MMKVKFPIMQVGRRVQRMRNILAILVLFVCTSICLVQSGQGQTTDINGDNYGNDVFGNGQGDKGGGPPYKNPRNNTVNINKGATNIGDVIGAYSDDVTAYADGTDISIPMTGNKVNVFKFDSGCGKFTGAKKKGVYGANIYGAWSKKTTSVKVNDNGVEISGGLNINNVYGGRVIEGIVFSNTVKLTDVDVKTDVYGGYVSEGTATENKVNMINVNVGHNVYGARIHHGLASSNEVTIEGGKMEGEVFGGWVVNGTAILNKVKLTGVNVDYNSVYGARIESGLASSNTVTITGGRVGRDVLGAEIERDGLASSNTVTIEHGKVKGNVYGGYIQQGTATLNTVNLTNVSVERGDIYGAKIEIDGLASSNTVTIKRMEIERNVYGGYIVKKGTATGNKINLTDVNVRRRDIYGAKIERDGLASSNTVTIERGEIEGNVYGGYIHQNGTATLNKVNLTDVSVSRDIYGAKIERDGLASSNEVKIKRGEIEGNVYGGYIQQGTATLNTVNLTCVTATKDVYGAKIERDGLASSNTVTIECGKIKRILYGGYVTIISEWGEIEGNVYGGYIVWNGTATLNKVDLTSVTVRKDVYGAWIHHGLASSNEVTIEGGEMKGDVFGGWVVNGTATGNKVDMTSVTATKDVYGARIGRGLASSNEVIIKGGRVWGFSQFKNVYGGIDVYGGNIYGGYIVKDGTATGNKVNLTSVTVMNDVYGAWIGMGLASSNTVTINGGYVSLHFSGGNVYGGYIVKDGTATGNKVNLTSVADSSFCSLFYVYGAKIERDGLASSNEVTIISGRDCSLAGMGLSDISWDVFGGYIGRNGTATGNKVDMTSVTVRMNVYGARIGKDGLASSNTVTITSGTVGGNVYGGYIEHNGKATGNTVTISGGKVKGNVFGGYVGGNGKATYNTINITATEQSSKQSFPEFSTATILCGGICAPNATTNDVFTGNTLNIETKGVEVKGISNFEKYKFHLKDIKTGETILTATSGGCSWNTVEYNYTSACAVDLSRSNIYLHTQGVLNKGEYCILIKSPKGFKDNVKYKKFDFENEEILIKYYWEVILTDDGQNLTAKLIDKKIRDGGVARSLSEGYGAGIVCVNNGMDCVLSKIEETESLLGERKGEIGAFYGLAANKSRYNISKGSHIDMIGMSMMGGVGVRVEVGRKELSSKEQSSSEQISEQSSPELSSKKLSSKEQSAKKLSSELTVGVFAEHGTGNSDIHCKKESKGTSSYVGGGLLGRYNIYEDEFSETKELSSRLSPKIYGEVILRAGQVGNSFNIKEAKADGTVKEYKYEYADAMYGGCALGGGYKHKVSEKIDLDWSLRYMFGYHGGKGVKQADADGNRAKFESVTSNRIRIGVRGKYVELEKVKPYAGIGCEYELSGKVKGAIQNGVDIIDIPASSFGGWTGVGELGVSGKVWKLGVDISGQGYLGVRKGFGGMLKLKYAFGKDAHGSLASSKAPGSKSPRS